MLIWMSFGAWLKQTRKSAKITQDTLAETVTAHGIKITAGYISNLERDYYKNKDGKPSRPSEPIVDAIAKALDVPIDEARLAAGYAPQSAVTRPTSIPELVTALQSLGIEMPQLFGGLPDPNNEGFQEILDRIYEDVELVTNRMKRGTKRIGVIPLELAEDEPDVELRLSKQNPISKI